MNVEKAVEKNKAARLYCLGKRPTIIKATKEFLQAWVDKNYSVTITKLADQYGCYPRTISKHAHALADILKIPRKRMSQTENPTFHRYPQFPRRLPIKCPKCGHKFDVAYSGRVLER